MSDTPRTDAHNWHDGDYDDPLDAFADFAKQLERELNAANERIKRLESVENIHAAVLNAIDNWIQQRKAKEAKL